MLSQPKFILFCNIDNNSLYRWWNFAAIIDFKWKTFGRLYYFLIWLFYTIFFACFAIASTFTDIYKKSLYITTVILGFIHLTFEIRQCFQDWKNYFRDPLNLFGKKYLYND
jgi:hypothetical protein